MEEKPNNDNAMDAFLHLLDVLVDEKFIRGVVTFVMIGVIVLLIRDGKAGIEIAVAILAGCGVVAVAGGSGGSITRHRNGVNGVGGVDTRNPSSVLAEPETTEEEPLGELGNREVVEYSAKDATMIDEAWILKTFPPALWVRTRLPDGGLVFMKKSERPEMYG